MKITCSLCEQDYVRIYHIKTNHIQFFGCPECDAAWYSEPLTVSRSTGLPTVLKSYGLEGIWSEVEEVSNGDFPEIPCPNCKNFNLGNFFRVADHLTVYGCKHCNAIWLSPDFDLPERKDFDTYFKSLGEMPNWSQFIGPH